MSSLDARIAQAFTSDDVTSDQLAALIAEAEDAAAYAAECADRARERALDPTLLTEEVAEQRRAAAFTRDRLSATLPRLRQRLE